MTRVKHPYGISVPCDILFVYIREVNRTRISNRSQGQTAGKEQAVVYAPEVLDRVYLIYGGNHYRYESITRDLPIIEFVLRSVSVVAAK